LCPEHRHAATIALVMLAVEPGWESISCRCRCRLRCARNPLADLSLAIVELSLGRCDTVVVLSCRRGLDVRCTTCSLAHTCARAHTHAHAYARRGKIALLPVYRPEPSSMAFRSPWIEESPSGKAFQPGSANAQSPSSLCAYSHTSQHGAPPAVATPAAPTSSHLSAMAHHVPTRVRTPSLLCLQLQARTRPRVCLGVRVPPASARPSPGQRLEVSRRPAAAPTEASTSPLRSSQSRPRLFSP
jgi:hypothetical protein